MHVRAIIVDDDQDTIEVYTEYLRWKGIDVVGVAHNGKKGLELWKKTKPDVTLLDVMMPEHDGFFALSEIRKLDSRAKIIMATADKTDETAIKLNEMGADAIVYKPYEIKRILEAIDNVLGGVKIYSELEQ